MGAPHAQTRQPGLDHPGAVYKCKPRDPASCDIIPFDEDGEESSAAGIWAFWFFQPLFLLVFPGNSLAPTGQQYDIKSGQWFGSVVRSSGENGTILASANSPLCT